MLRGSWSVRILIAAATMSWATGGTSALARSHRARHSSPAPMDVPELLRMVRSSRVRTRVQAARLLGYVGGRRVVAALIASLKSDPEPLVRAEAATSLGRLRAQAAIPDLVRALSGNPDVAEAASAALMAMGAACLPAVSGVLQRGNEQARILAVRILGRIGGSRVLPVLEKTVLVGSRRVSRAAVRAMGALRDPRAVPFLLKLLDRGPAFLQDDATEALKGLVSVAGVQVVRALFDRRYSDIRDTLTEVVVEVDDPKSRSKLLPYLLGGLLSRDEEVRDAALGILIHWQELCAVPYLKKIYRRSRKGFRFRILVASVWFGPKAARELLALGQSDPEPRLRMVASSLSRQLSAKSSLAALVPRKRSVCPKPAFVP